MPLTIKTDIPNIDDQTNNEHYNLAVLMMATGVPEIRKDSNNDLIKFVSRVALLDVFPRNGTKNLTAEELISWVRKFGHIRTNANSRTDADVLKSARLRAEDAIRSVLEAL